MTYQDIVINHPDSMTDKEAMHYVSLQFESLQHELKNIASIDISLDGDEVVMKAKKKSSITRIRRITGYCSKISSFKDAKRAELADRKAHI